MVLVSGDDSSTQLVPIFQQYVLEDQNTHGKTSLMGLSRVGYGSI